MDRAARIAITETKNFLERNATVEKVVLVCFGTSAFDLYTGALKKLSG
jgi:O-acetyl-ADP-ribose deacetylase (regulator of RNase III)